MATQAETNHQRVTGE